MKNNLLFLLVLVALFATALGALYYQYQFGDLTQETTEEVLLIEEPDATTPDTTATDQKSLEAEPELEALPEISTADDLETIMEELDATVILEEDFSDL